jgi:hypothetical protein
MTKKQRIIISLGAMIGGLLLCGHSLSTTLGQPVPVISIVFGLAFSVGGFISLVLTLKSHPGEKSKE